MFLRRNPRLGRRRAGEDDEIRQLYAARAIGRPRDTCAPGTYGPRPKWPTRAAGLRAYLFAACVKLLLQYYQRAAAACRDRPRCMHALSPSTAIQRQRQVVDGAWVAPCATTSSLLRTDVCARVLLCLDHANNNNDMHEVCKWDPRRERGRSKTKTCHGRAQRGRGSSVISVLPVPAAFVRPQPCSQKHSLQKLEGSRCNEYSRYFCSCASIPHRDLYDRCCS